MSVIHFKRDLERSQTDSGVRLNDLVSYKLNNAGNSKLKYRDIIITVTVIDINCNGLSTSNLPKFHMPKATKYQWHQKHLSRSDSMPIYDTCAFHCALNQYGQKGMFLYRFPQVTVNPVDQIQTSSASWFMSAMSSKNSAEFAAVCTLRQSQEGD